MHNLLGDTHGRCLLTVLYQSMSIEHVVAAERTSAWCRGPRFDHAGRPRRVARYWNHANKSVCNLRGEATAQQSCLSVYYCGDVWHSATIQPDIASALHVSQCSCRLSAVRT